MERNLAMVTLAMGLAFCVAGPVAADERPYNRVPAFDFTDEFYRANGINPEKLLNRVNGTDGVSVVDASPHPDFRDVRIVETTGGFKHNGSLLYYVIAGMVMPDTFTNDPAGARAMAIANSFRAFLFPKKDGDPLSPAPGNRRQDNIFETDNGYFSNNPLGLWLLTFVSWDGPRVASARCRREMDRLAAENGRDLDGTPVIKTKSDILNLESMGCVRLRTRALDGSQGFPWVV